MTNEYVLDHVEVLKEYIKLQHEIVQVAKFEPTDDFEQNSHYIRSMELDNQMIVLTEKLNKTIENLGKIPA